MSEYQFVAFRAVDAAVSEENLAYMHKQSSRAEITPWSFENEYHYSDFRGNVPEMMRRGYDVHLHYANFGTRTLAIRLPQGLPDKSGAEAYLLEDFIQFIADKDGPGGILHIKPMLETDYFDEIYDVKRLFERLIPLREEILDGDLRPLYLAHLGVSQDMEHDPDESREGPVPAGLDKLTDAQQALAELYGLSDALIDAAAVGAPALEARNDPRREYSNWLNDQSSATKDAWLLQLMSEANSTVRSEIITAFRKDHAVSGWPTAICDRTVSELEVAAEEIQLATDTRLAAVAAKKRAKFLATVAADPTQTLRETDELVKERKSSSYAKIGQLLTDLRDALAGTDQAGLAEKQAKKLKSTYPTYSALIKELRRVGFLPK